jgi:ABC-type multidrug transport system ATPase subunit
MKGKTTIIISHDLNLVRSADRILVVRQGRVEEQGTHEELLGKEGLYASLYARQFGRAEPEPALVGADGAAEEEEADLSPQVFQTMLMEALPRPAERKVFEHTMGDKGLSGASDGLGEAGDAGPRPRSRSRILRRSK